MGQDEEETLASVIRDELEQGGKDQKPALKHTQLQSFERSRETGNVHTILRFIDVVLEYGSPAMYSHFSPKTSMGIW
jgi:hypothetical protein